MAKFAVPFRPSNNHYTSEIGTYKERVTNAELQYLLLNYPEPMVQGRLCEWNYKRLAAGVYDLWVKSKQRNGDDALEGRDFFELMQLYRHSQNQTQAQVIQHFENVKKFIRIHFKAK